MFDIVIALLYNTISNRFLQRGMLMRKTELIFGICAGASGLVLAVLALFSFLPFSPDAVHGLSQSTLNTYALICVAANVLGIAGALLVQKLNIAGALIMAVSMIAIMLFGFPWQSLPAVLYIISLVMAVVPVKAAAKNI